MTGIVTAIMTAMGIVVTVMTAMPSDTTTILAVEAVINLEGTGLGIDDEKKAGSRTMRIFGGTEEEVLKTLKSS